MCSSTGQKATRALIKNKHHHKAFLWEAQASRSYVEFLFLLTKSSALADKLKLAPWVKYTLLQQSY